MTSSRNLCDLVIVVLRDGEVLSASAAVAIDLGGPGTCDDPWRALVERARVDELVSATGARVVVDPVEWDGGRFEAYAGTVELLGGHIVGTGSCRDMTEHAGVA